MGLLDKIKLENETNSTSISLFNICKKKINRNSKFLKHLNKIENLLLNYSIENSNKANRLLTIPFESEYMIPVKDSKEYYLRSEKRVLSLFKHIELENNLSKILDIISILQELYSKRKKIKQSNCKPFNLFIPVGLVFSFFFLLKIGYWWSNYKTWDNSNPLLSPIISFLGLLLLIASFGLFVFLVASTFFNIQGSINHKKNISNNTEISIKENEIKRLITNANNV